MNEDDVSSSGQLFLVLFMVAMVACVITLVMHAIDQHRQLPTKPESAASVCVCPTSRPSSEAP